MSKNYYNPRQIPQDEIDLIVELYNQSWTLQRIAEHVGRTAATVKHVMARERDRENERRSRERHGREQHEERTLERLIHLVTYTVEKRHPAIKPPTFKSDFIKPPTMAQLMGRK
jgi:IS30 family transposase